MHLLRGSGLAGLAGMRPSRMMPTWSATAPLVRPMLGVWRNEVEAYCRQESLPAVDDESNRDERLLRNWVRHRLVPFLLDRYPQAKQAIERLAAIAREEDAYLAGLTRTKSRRLSSASPTGGVVVERARFAREPLAMQRRLVREWGQQMLPGWELGFEAVDEIVGWMISQEAATLQGFSGAIWGARLRDEIRLECSPEGLAGQDEFPHMEDEEFGLAAAGAYPLGRGWELQLSVVEKADGGEAETGMVLGADEARFTLDAVTVTGLTVRRRHPGDRLVPYGMKGHSVKLSDLFINAKVPGFLREGWPVVCLDGQPVWVPRLRAAAEAHFRGGPPYWRLRLARRDADG
jgi:tRNA(Ile)-lysidine synthase